MRDKNCTCAHTHRSCHSGSIGHAHSLLLYDQLPHTDSRSFDLGMHCTNYLVTVEHCFGSTGCMDDLARFVDAHNWIALVEDAVAVCACSAFFHTHVVVDIVEVQWVGAP